MAEPMDSSIFDLIESSQPQPDGSPIPLPQDTDELEVDTNAGHVSIPGKRNNDIFSLEHVQFQQFQFPSSLVDLRVASNIMFIAFTASLLRIDLDNPLEIAEFPITLSKTDSITRIFSEPSAKQLIVTTVHAENYLVYEAVARHGSVGALYTVKRLNKFKGIMVTAVAWNSLGQQFYIGTQDGKIYETRHDALQEEPRQVYELDPPMPITGLYTDRLALITTPTRIYRFVENRDARVNRRSKHVFDQDPEIQELPGDLKHRGTHFFTKANAFAWLTGDGVYYGKITSSIDTIKDSIANNKQLIPYPAFSTPSRPNHIPMSVAVSRFHIILLYSDRICAISLLTGDMVYEERIALRRGESVRGLAIDNDDKNCTTYWVTTNAAIHELTIKKEDRDVWKFYFDKKQYDTALEYCKEPEQKDSVYTAMAKEYFNQRRFQQSATCFAETKEPFEKVVLQFMAMKERDSLRTYIKLKLEYLPPHNQQQKALLAMWLVEMYLGKLNQLEERASSVTCMSTLRNKSNYSTGHKEQKQRLQDEFAEFLETYQYCLHKPTVYQLISSHGLGFEMLRYAELISDYDKAIEYRIHEEDWNKVLQLLDSSGDQELMYRLAPQLMEYVPCQTVDSWIEKPYLNTRRLIPALLRYDHTKIPDKTTENQAMRFLSHVISVERNTDTVIHNLLLSLHASQTTRDETALLAFLNNEGREMHYDLDYALRICNQYERIQSCIHVYSEMGLYEEAVGLALKRDDLNLALVHADKPLGDDELRKRLWLIIERYVIQDKGAIKTAMELLRKCDLLRIEDILPFFPEYVLIDDFKDEICTALEEYNIHIDELKAEMDDATNSSDAIRLDVRKLRLRFTSVQVVENCCMCQYPVLTRQFYVFPCNHKYHADCLINKTTKHLPTWQIRRMANLQERLSRELSKSASVARSSRLFHTFPADEERMQHARTEHTDRLKEELDDIVARECVLCGDIMIKSIDRPFISDEETNLVVSWTV